MRTACAQEHEKSKSLWRIAHEVKSEIHKTETLLYQMLPRPVARLMRSGSCNAMDTCKAHLTIDQLIDRLIHRLTD